MESLMGIEEDAEMLGLTVPDLEGFIETSDEGYLMLSGFLKPNGEWVALPYMGHETWACEECGRLGIEYKISVGSVETIMDRGYVQISNGTPFLIKKDLSSRELTNKQLDFFIINVDKMERQTKRILVNRYGVVFPGVERTPPPTKLVEPPEYLISE